MRKRNDNEIAVFMNGSEFLISILFRFYWKLELYDYLILLMIFKRILFFYPAMVKPV